MKVILLRDMTNLGKRGDVVTVADAYAINVLLKKGDAVQATGGELAKWKAKKESDQRKKDTALSSFHTLVTQLRDAHLVISGKKHDEKGQLFASVKESDIAEVIYNATQVSISEKQIILPQHIKSVGEHSFILKQGHDEYSFMVTIE